MRTNQFTGANLKLFFSQYKFVPVSSILRAPSPLNSVEKKLCCDHKRCRNLIVFLIII